MRITVDREYAVGGASYPQTYIWAEPQTPMPAFGDVIGWDHRHVMVAGRTWRKVEYDSNPSEPLH